jgi:hypothetical protein
LILPRFIGFLASVLLLPSRGGVCILLSKQMIEYWEGNDREAGCFPLECGVMRYFLALVFIISSVAATWAGTLTPGLDQAYTNRQAKETLPVLIVLSDRVPAPELAARLPRLALTLAEIHQVVMDSLQIHAGESQAAVLKSIEILAANGMAKNARPLWICNMISADLNRAAAELVANMAEVSEVGLDETVTLRKAVETTPSEAMHSHVEDALIRCDAPEAWRMGYTGENRIVCSLGDGVYAAHPALSARWRGRSSAASQCWYDPAGSTNPMSCGVEGTAMTGAICGADGQTGDTIGVAPAATWIAARVFCSQAKLSDVFRALQWAIDPDGQSSTFDDVPDAICSAWGMDSPCGGAAPDSAWEAMENAEAMGPVLIFAAGNSSGGAGTVRAPESLAECFGVGNVDTRTSEPVINVASARGPSSCDPTLTKPDLVAPGTAIRSAAASGYQKVTSTSIAAAYTAGTVALMRQASPNLPAAEIKRLLAASATDLGAPGADNTSGAGMLNAQQAVIMALSSGPTGTVDGLVQYGGQPISGARVVLSGHYGDLVTTTVGGVFRFDHVPAAQSYAIRTGRFGFKNYLRTDSVLVNAGKMTSVVISLERGFEDNATTDQGWRFGVEGDNATSGVWVRDKPVGSLYEGQQIQPDRDAPPEDGFCFVTGNGSSPTADAKEADVSGGHTTLRSPPFSLKEIADADLEFSYWYSNDQGPNAGSDFFRAQISSDGGATWTNIVNTAASTHGWHTVKVPVSDFATPTGNMLLQFIAEDEGPNSLIEAAVDDISITGAPNVPEPPRDLTMDVQFDQVLLTWRPSRDATAYRVYVSGDPDKVIAPENLYTTTPDTNLVVPLKDIHFNEFYFQVTAARPSQR